MLGGRISETHSLQFPARRWSRGRVESGILQVSAGRGPPEGKWLPPVSGLGGHWLWMDLTSWEPTAFLEFQQEGFPVHLSRLV